LKTGELALSESCSNSRENQSVVTDVQCSPRHMKQTVHFRRSQRCCSALGLFGFEEPPEALSNIVLKLSILNRNA